jgi:hypothetical protein
LTLEIEKTATEQLQRWLRSKALSRSIHCLTGGIVFCILGLITIVITTWGAAFVTLMLALHVSAAFSLGGMNVHVLRASLLWGIVAFIVVLSFWEAWRNPYGLGSFRQGVHLQDRVSGAMLKAMGSIFGDLFLAGPRMMFSGFESFWECQHLSRTNFKDAASVLLWTFERNRKVSIEELAKAFPGVNLVRLMPQLRLLTGLIWLPSRRGVCILGSDLTSELQEMLEDEFPTDAYEEPAASPAEEGIGFPEERRWYAALGLEIYAPLREVKKRYRVLARQFHPDRIGQSDSNARDAGEERMKQINEAYRNICRRFAE